MDAEIDILCQMSPAISILEACDGVFALMRVQSPSQTEKEQAKEKIENAMRLHHELCLLITPKVHPMEEHTTKETNQPIVCVYSFK